MDEHGYKYYILTYIYYILLLLPLLLLLLLLFFGHEPFGPGTFRSRLGSLHRSNSPLGRHATRATFAWDAVWVFTRPGAGGHRSLRVLAGLLLLMFSPQKSNFVPGSFASVP